jgi:hypothetical protein
LIIPHVAPENQGYTLGDTVEHDDPEDKVPVHREEVVVVDG